MTISRFPIEKLQSLSTPFYYYDMELLRSTIKAVRQQAQEPNLHVHYALKACVAPPVLQQMAKSGFGADCVSGGEVDAALKAGIPPEKIVFAGVAKADWEIRLALERNIYCFNVESLPELENINLLAGETGKRARVALRINPNVDAHTHRYITTGLQEDKFGIAMQDMLPAVKRCVALPNIDFIGLHFHIGSQITDMNPYKELCLRINELVNQVETSGIRVDYINVGGGLGVDYEEPDQHAIPDFRSYFDIFRRYLHVRTDQQVHFELGRSLVAQMGSLMTRVLYIKQGVDKQFCIIDAGMTDLIRPALYHAFHKIENLTATTATEELYDVVGPICESSDVFLTNYRMPATRRGDLLAIRTAGAYGETMASCYNLRRLPGHVTFDELNKNI